MAKTITVEVTTQLQTFPLGTQEEKFHFELRNKADGSVLSQIDVQTGGVNFPEVPPGDYTVVVSKNGVSVSQDVSIAKTEENFQVPQSLTITVS